MDPASRNRVLMVGGGLIVIALLLVCGPLEGQFGEGQKTVEPLPPVAAAPPVPAIDPQALAEAVATGAVTGAVIGESDLGADIEEPAEAAARIAEAVVPPAPAPVVEHVRDAAPKVADVTPKKSAPKLPAVSAAGPMIAAPIGPTAEELAANAANDFDNSIGDAAKGFDSSVVDRFAPPVDSGPRISPVASAAQGFNSLALRPCDSPGAGCQNVVAPRRAFKPPGSGAGGR